MYVAHYSVAGKDLITCEEESPRPVLLVRGNAMLKGEGRGWSRLARDERGAVAIVFGLSAMALAAAAGTAIDYSRYTNVRTQIQVALDSAVLAGGRAMQINSDDFSAATAVAQNFFKLQMAKTLAGSVPDASFSAAEGNTAIEGSVTVPVATPVLSFLNINALTATATSKAKFSIGGGPSGGSNLEISLMLDMTGSMCEDGNGPCNSGDKIDALKEAAKDLVNIVVKDGSSQMTRVALVPFGTRVRVGPPDNAATNALMATLTGLPATWSGYYNECVAWTGSGGDSESAGNWSCTDYDVVERTNWLVMPCVTDRTGDEEFTDAAPGNDQWLNAHDGGRFPLSWDSSNTAITDHLGGSAADPAEHWNFGDGGYCGDDYDESNTILPLTSEKGGIISHIEGLRAVGATAGQLGTAWSWYMLSPNWSGIWTGDSAPGPYSDLTAMENGVPKLRKIAVLMTDGHYNTYRGWKDFDPDTVSNNAVTICNNMKAAGIEVFTVGFALDELPDADKARAMNTLRSCGTDLQHFYDAINAAQLKQSFQAIALELSKLYLVR